MYAITWLDPASHTDVELKAPLKSLAGVRTNYGMLIQEKDSDWVAIISADFSQDPEKDKEKDFTLIHKALIINVQEFEPKRNPDLHKEEQRDASGSSGSDDTGKNKKSKRDSGKKNIRS